MTDPRSPQPDPLTPEERMPDLTTAEVTALNDLPKHGSQYEIDGAIYRDRLVTREVDGSSPIHEDAALYDRRILLVTLRSALASIHEVWDAGYGEGIEQDCSNCGAALTPIPSPDTDLRAALDAVAAMASVLVLAERDGQWPHYTKIARRAYDAAGGTLRKPRPLSSSESTETSNPSPAETE